MRSKTAVAATALVLGFLLLTHPVVAQAAAKITGKDIKNGTVTTKDIKNGSLKAVDFRSGQLHGIVASASSSHAGSVPSTTQKFLHWADVVVGDGQAVHVTSSKSMGSTVAGGGLALHLYPCYRVKARTTTPVLLGGGVIDQRVAQGARQLFTLSAVIPDLPPGEYRVGLCGASEAPSSWNANEAGYTTALVYADAGTDQQTGAMQPRRRP